MLVLLRIAMCNRIPKDVHLVSSFDRDMLEASIIVEFDRIPPMTMSLAEKHVLVIVQVPSMCCY